MLTMEKFDNEVVYIHGRLGGGTYLSIRPTLEDFKKFVDHTRKGLFSDLDTGHKEFFLYSVKDTVIGSKLFTETGGNAFVISPDDSMMIVQEFNKFYDDLNEEEEV